jgi:hypothetical protein
MINHLTVGASELAGKCAALEEQSHYDESLTND